MLITTTKIGRKYLKLCTLYKNETILYIGGRVGPLIYYYIYIYIFLHIIYHIDTITYNEIYKIGGRVGGAATALQVPPTCFHPLFRHRWPFSFGQVENN